MAGTTLGLTEEEWRKVQYAFMVVIGNQHSGLYRAADEYLYAAYDEVAKIVVRTSSDWTVVDTAVTLVQFLCRLHLGSSFDTDRCLTILRPKAKAWHGKLGLMKEEYNAGSRPPTPTKAAPVDVGMQETGRDAAVATLESKPGFARANSRIFDKIETLHIAEELGRTVSGSESRMSAVVKIFDVRAKELLVLVDDIPSQKAYVAALAQICKVAWAEFTDIPYTEMNQTNLQVKQIWSQFVTRATRRWESKGFKKLANAGRKRPIKQKRPQNTAPVKPISITEERQSLIAKYKSLCRENGVKVTDKMIAKAASSSWNDRTQVTWWKRNDDRSKPVADRLIRAVFTKKSHLPKP